MTDSGQQDNGQRLLELCKRGLFVLPCLLVAFAFFLAIMHHFVWQYGIDKSNHLTAYFDLDGEDTIPSWFASIQWFMVALAAVLAFFLEKASKVSRWLEWWWLIFAVVFLVASADEASMIHETAGSWLEAILKSRGMGLSVWEFFDESPWLVFYVLPLFVFIGTSLLFLLDRLKAHIKVFFLGVTGFSFYLAALIIEFIQGMPDQKLSPIAEFCGVTCYVFYTRSVLLEETLENLGTAAVLMAVLLYCYILAQNLTSTSVVEQEK